MSDVNETNLQKLFLGIDFFKAALDSSHITQIMPTYSPQGNTYTHHWKENRRGKLEALVCLLFQNPFCYFSVSLNWPFSLSWDKLGLKVGLSRDETAFKKTTGKRKKTTSNTMQFLFLSCHVPTNTLSVPIISKICSLFYCPFHLNNTCINTDWIYYLNKR